MNIPDTLLYSKSHEWVKIENNIATVGITDFAQQELSDIVNLELNDVGSEVELDGEVGEIEAVKAASEIFSPVAGKIIEVNEKVLTSPEIINKDPYGEGWMFKIELTESLEDIQSRLMDSSRYKKFLEEE